MTAHIIPQVDIKTGDKLTLSELNQIRDSIFREFKQRFKPEDSTKDKLFFLLKQDQTVLAFGAIVEIEPVIFDQKEYLFFAILNVIANEKGKGYGKQVVSSIREYLVAHDLIGIGFCIPKNREFYEKCGFKTTINTTHRFVYLKDNKRITNQDGQLIFYQDSSKEFMKQVLSEPSHEVYIPTPDLW